MALRSAMTAIGGAGMGYLLLVDSGDSGNAVAVAIALLLMACAAAHARTLAGTLHDPARTGLQSPLVRAGQAASAVMATGMVIMLL
jgi:hypothetical protein